MVRKLEKRDIDTVADIWLHGNLQTHDFINESYWKSNYDLVKKMFFQAEMYIYEKNGEIQGFIGLDEEYIAGLFVVDSWQSKGVGKKLMDFVKERKEKLSLKVYEKNTDAIRFYQREGFQIFQESRDLDTGEKEFIMKWRSL